MSTNIDLGTFTFNADEVDKQIEQLRKRMFELRTEQSEYRKSNADLEKTIQSLVGVQKLLENSGQKETEQYKRKQAEIDKLRKEQEKLFLKQQDLSKQQKEVNNEYREASKLVGMLTDSEGRRVTSTEALNVALEREVKSIADARASNKELLALRNQLNIADGENAEELAALNKQLDENNAFIKENVSAYEQQKIGIGDYQTAIENALGGTRLFGVGLNDVKNTMGQLTPILGLIKTELTTITATFKGTTAATQGMSAAQKAAAVTTNGLSAALKLFRIALIATGIGAIVVVLGSLIAFLSSTQAGIDKVTSVTRPLQAIFGALVGILQEVGEFLFKAFSNPLDTISTLYDFIKNQIMRQFEAFGKILEGIFTLDFGLIKEGFSDLADQAKEAIDAIGGAVDEFGNRIAEAARKGVEIDRIQKEIERREIDIIQLRAKTNLQLKEQETIAKNQLLSDEERRAAIEEQTRLARVIVDEENKILDLAIKQLEIKQSLNDTSREEEKALQELYAARIKNEELIADTEKRNLGAIRQLENERESQKKQAHTDALARIKEAQDAAIEANKQALDLFLAAQGYRRKSAEEELATAEETAKRKKAILEQQYEFGRISETEYQTQLIQIQDEFLKLQRDLTIENAERELEIQLQLIEDKKNENAKFTEAYLEQEKERIQLAKEQEEAFLQLQFDEGLLNEQEYQDALAEIRANARERETEAILEWEESEKERKLIDEENQRIIEEEKFVSEFEKRQARLDMQREQEIAAAEKTGADVSLIEQKFALRQQQLDEQVQRANLQMVADTYGQISNIIGKETEAGKAFALAQALINTYQGISAGVALGFPAAIPAVAAATATGFGAVRNITKTKVKAEQGFKVPRRGTMLKGKSHAQGGIVIEAEGGEAIINKRSTEMFGDLLSSINQAGGGVPLARRGAVAGVNSSNSSIIQNRLMGQLDAGRLSEAMGQAVREGATAGTATGAAVGSRAGIRELSTDRQIQRESAF